MIMDYILQKIKTLFYKKFNNGYKEESKSDVKKRLKSEGYHDFFGTFFKTESDEPNTFIEITKPTNNKCMERTIIVTDDLGRKTTITIVEV